MKFRGLVERFWRDRSVKRHLPKEFGGRPIIVSPDAALRWLRLDESAFEQTLLTVIKHCITPGMVVWDIGANVGAFAFPAAYRSRAHVVAVEADPFLAGLLRRTASDPANADLKVEIFCAAVSDRPGAARFLIAGRGRASSGLDSGNLSTQHGKSRAEMTVPTLSLDAMLADFPEPGFVKIDVEGSELLALAGAERLLTQVRPIVYLEVNDVTRDSACRHLQTAGYDLFDGDAAPDERAPIDPLTNHNILAIPRPY